MPDRYIEMGITALRDPATGDFLPAVPLYIKETYDARESKAQFIFNLAIIFRDKMNQYIDDGGNIPKTGGRSEK